MAGDSDGYDTNLYLAGITVLIILIVLSYTMSYFRGVISSASTNSIKKLKTKNAQKALDILENDERYLRRFRIGFLYALCGSAVICELMFQRRLAYLILNILPDFFASYVIAVIVVLFAAVFFGSSVCGLAAERIGSAGNSSRIVKFASGIEFMNITLAPLTILPELLSDAMLRLTGSGRLNDEDSPTEEEILMMVDEGEESGVIEGNTKDMIENIFDFDDTSVGEIMTHRKDVVAVRDDALLTDVADAAIKSGKSRIPVYHEDIDDIVGIIHVKDLLPYISKDRPTEKIDGSIIKEAVFVPESKRCSEMFEYMTQNKTQIAVVVDEFGGTGGIITMEDLVESIVGSIQDEFDNEDEEIRKLDENRFTVDGAASLDEIAELTGLSFEEDDNDTLAGVMLDRMGHIPKPGEHPSVVINGVRFTVQEVENRRIAKVLVVRKNNK